MDATSLATVWATIGLVTFLGILVYVGVPKQILGMLDDKSKKIADDLDEAKRLREEAQSLLAEYERKRQAAEDEAQEIVEAAKAEATRLTEEAQASLEDLITRRTKAVEEKIAQAESQAIADVRARSADIAVEAARHVLVDKMAEKGDALVEQAIKDVSASLN
ncbi:F0F1 ATP synthase subunit B family protein [Maritalea porphyrae]|uniref:ATP synthase subunit b n=1 Tax=Maritalea porphyrae TaxID=880732 RepID=A0ABQ5URA0_9HYPH|nr:ATP F0F1 synthase subunit B [Maritalea porphyrae]GLQ17793.1 ATP synthase subunit b [Maritalea porphyrae]